MIISYMEVILKDLFTMIYQYAGITIIVTMLFMFMWKQAEKTSWREIYKNLMVQFKDKVWKKRFIAILYIVFVLQRTLFNRSPWGEPLGNIIGPWGFIVNGMPNYEMFENIMLFIPLYPIVKMSGIIDHIKHWRQYLPLSILIITFECSVGIEIVQLMTRAGTFQLSDIVYNTVGGVVGGIVYWIAYTVKQRKKDRKNSDE